MEPAFTPANMYNLADRWLNIANLDTDKRITLFEDTDKLADSLNKMKGSNALTVKERMAGLTENLLKAFNSHSVGEATTTAHYIATNNPGAHGHLHLLFDAVKSASGKTADSPDLKIMAYIDSKSIAPEFKIQEKILALDLAEIERHLLFDKDKVNLEPKDLLAVRDVSQASRATVDAILITKLNAEEIDFQSIELTSIKQVVDFFGEENIKKIKALQLTEEGAIHPKASHLFSSVDDVIYFFGDDCKKIKSLHILSEEFTPPRPLYQTLLKAGRAVIGGKYVYELSGEKLAQKLSKSFPNLFSLKSNINVELFPAPDIVKIKNLKLPHLQSCEINCNRTLDLDFVNNFPQLEFFKTFNLLTNSASLRNCPNLRHLELNTGYVDKLNFLQGCPKLESLIAGCKNNDLVGLENLKNLTLIDLEGFLVDTSYKEEEALNLSKHPKLVKGTLRMFPIKKLNVSESNLESLSLRHLFKLQTLNLTNCTKLQKVDLVGCPVKNVETENCDAISEISLVSCENIDAKFLQKYSHSLEKLRIRRCPNINISKEVQFPVLAELTISAADIQDVRSFVQQCPHLVTLYLNDIKNLNPTLLEDLPASFKKLVVQQGDKVDENVLQALKERGVEYEFGYVLTS